MHNIINQQKKLLEQASQILRDNHISIPNSKSTNDPFFRMTIDEQFDIDKHFINDNNTNLDFNEKLKQITSLIPNTIYFIYKLLGDSDREFSIHNCTFFSLNQLLDRHKIFIENKQTNIIDLGTFYLGMGHVAVITRNLTNGMLFTRKDGGSNGYERQDSFKKSLALDPTHIDKKYLFSFEDFIKDGTNLDNFSIYPL